jgi:tRNA G37 N-methylase Trm5
MKNRVMKNLHIASGVALIGFSFWHHMLYQPEKKEKQKRAILEIEAKSLTSDAISIDDIYTHVKVKGKLTKEDILVFEEKLDSLINSYKVEKINTLIDIKDLKNVEFLAIWNDFIFLLKHYEIIGKVAIVGNKALQDLSVKITNKLTPSSMQYFDSCEEAKKWIL